VENSSLTLSDFDYSLPEELIAQEPLADRAAARMLVVDRASQTWTDHAFREFPQFLRPGDCVVLNDSRVFPSRLYGYREQGTGRVEVFLTRSLSADGLTWQALVRPGRKMRTGERIYVPSSAHAADPALTIEVMERGEFGERTVRLHPKGDLFEVLDRVGHVPLPPYIHRPDNASDRERYQTVFAQRRGSVAAPTAGLHFTPEILEKVRKAGAEIACVTLHVGLGTFQPLHTEVLENVQLHSESMIVSAEAHAAIERATRVVAVGTTSVRAIESDPHCAETDLFIRPGFQFRRTGALLTNFHLPKSSLLVLVCAFGGIDLVLAAYRYAVSQRYRFYSYGDCMLII
jgi:S-adenosylmethionine:tRNA ribosyltransferase-isomerase